MGYGSGTYGSGTYGSSAPGQIKVREKPPLRLHREIITPSGRHYRWADDEPNPANVPSGGRHSSIMPGGYESSECVLPRKPSVDYSDVERLSTLIVRGAGGEIANECRLERAPRTSGNEMSISPSAVGWSTHLDDDKSAKMIYRDIDLSRWTGPSVERKINLLTGSIDYEDPSTIPDTTTGAPSLETAITGPWARVHRSEAQYDANGIPIGSLYYAWKRGSTAIDNADTNWTWLAQVMDDDTFISGDTTASLRAAGPGSGTITATTSTRVFAGLVFQYGVASGGDGQKYPLFWTTLAVYGDHGLTLRGTEPSAGFYGSDVVAHAARAWAPLLNFTEGTDGTIKPGGFAIPQLAFLEPTTASEIIKQAGRFELPYWGVWDNRELHWDPSRTPRKRWRLRVAPAQLEETGPTIERLFESVVVQFSDVDGSTKTVGPPGSRADTESVLLKDSDPENPANQLGIVRRDVLQMGTGTIASATEVGARWLEEQKLIDRSGRARVVGFAEDDRGVWWPYWKIRAGDTAVFTDAADVSERRIVKADHDDSARTCSMDLDAPPEGLQATLERLSVGLVSLGIGN